MLHVVALRYELKSANPSVQPMKVGPILIITDLPITPSRHRVNYYNSPGFCYLDEDEKVVVLKDYGAINSQMDYNALFYIDYPVQPTDQYHGHLDGFLSPDGKVYLADNRDHDKLAYALAVQNNMDRKLPYKGLEDAGWMTLQLSKSHIGHYKTPTHDQRVTLNEIRKANADIPDIVEMINDHIKACLEMYNIEQYPSYPELE